MFQQLLHLEQFNDLIVGDAFRPEFLKGFDIRKPIRIPKAFADDADKWYHIPHIEMSPERYIALDWQTKLDRGSANIEPLIEDGRRRGHEFLEARKRIVEGGTQPRNWLLSTGWVGRP